VSSSWSFRRRKVIGSTVPGGSSAIECIVGLPSPTAPPAPRGPSGAADGPSGAPLEGEAMKFYAVARRYIAPTDRATRHLWQRPVNDADYSSSIYERSIAT